MKVGLNHIANAKEFNNIVQRFEGNAVLKSGRYVIDAKSILGIFSLDLSNPVEIEYTGEDKEEFFKSINKFLVE